MAAKLRADDDDDDDEDVDDEDVDDDCWVTTKLLFAVVLGSRMSPRLLLLLLPAIGTMSTTLHALHWPSVTTLVHITCSVCDNDSWNDDKLFCSGWLNHA